MKILLSCFKTKYKYILESDDSLCACGFTHGILRNSLLINRRLIFEFYFLYETWPELLFMFSDRRQQIWCADRRQQCWFVSDLPYRSVTLCLRPIGSYSQDEYYKTIIIIIKDFHSILVQQPATVVFFNSNFAYRSLNSQHFWCSGDFFWPQTMKHHFSQCNSLTHWRVFVKRILGDSGALSAHAGLCYQVLVCSGLCILICWEEENAEYH